MQSRNSNKSPLSSKRRNNPPQRQTLQARDASKGMILKDPSIGRRMHGGDFDEKYIKDDYKEDIGVFGSNIIKNRKMLAASDRFFIALSEDNPGLFFNTKTDQKIEVNVRLLDGNLQKQLGYEYDRKVNKGYMLLDIRDRNPVHYMSSGYR